VDIKGGVSYFLWDKEHSGDCEFTLIRGDEVIGPELRRLDEFDILIRDIRGVRILRKVLEYDSEPLADIVSARWAFGTDLTSNFSKWYSKRQERSVRLYMQGGDRERWVDPEVVTRNQELIEEWKVLLPKAGPGNSGGHVLPDMVLGRPLVSEPGSVCTLTYLVVGPLPDEAACKSLSSYLRTRFARFLVSLRKPSQDAPRGVYTWVPQQTWDRKWTDEQLYAKYRITDDEITLIENMIRPMDSDDE
jgi:site-specific DNA-methyltransferase (adenine-specific)